MSKTTKALKLAKESLECLPEMCGVEEALAAIREALADQFRGVTKMVAEPVKHSEHYWLHEINNARADGYERGYERGYAAGKSEPVKQEPVAFIENGIFKFNIPSVHSSVEKGLLTGKHELYAEPVDAKAIRAEALEEAAKVCNQYAAAAFIDYPEDRSLSFAGNECAAAIRWLK